MRRIALLLALAGLLAVPAASDATPPSFALWTAKWKAQSDKPLDDLADKCIAIYGETADRKVGECFVKGMRVIVRRQIPQWERAVAWISKGQTRACKKAIHAYWLASRKGQKAS